MAYIGKCGLSITIIHPKYIYKYGDKAIRLLEYIFCSIQEIFVLRFENAQAFNNFYIILLYVVNKISWYLLAIYGTNTTSNLKEFLYWPYVAFLLLFLKPTKTIQQLVYCKKTQLLINVAHSDRYITSFISTIRI